MQKSTNNPRLDTYLKEKMVLSSFLKNAGLKKIPVISIETGRFLELACLAGKPGNILEIGCGTGFSTYFLVKNLKPKSSYIGIDLNRDRLRKAESFISGIFPGRRLTFIGGDALKITPGLSAKHDLVFIDAAKFEYPDYIKVVEKKLLPGAIVIADNIFYRNKIFNGDPGSHDAGSVGGIRRYIDHVTGSKQFKTEFFEVGDGLAVSEYMP